LAVFIVGIYFLEEYFGGSQNVAVLVRMGANVSARVKGGEYYRLLSSVFLHAGLMHVFFNTYVLFALGGFFNRIFGDAKFLTVFFASGLCGSLSSVFLGKSAVSVGASGAIWGLFGSSLALAFFKTSLLPEMVRLRLRRVTFINLLINLGISFLPMIDMWAHIGGGIGGFLVSLLIIFRPKNPLVYRLSMRFFQVAALLLGMAYVGSIGYGMWMFEPWTNQLKSDLVNINLVDVPFIMAVPAGLKLNPATKNTATSAHYVFGDLGLDRLVMEAHFFHQAILGRAANNEWLSAQREVLLAEPTLPAKVKKTIDLRTSPQGPVLYYQQTPKNGDLVIHNYVITKGEYAVKIALIASEKIGQTEVDALAKKIIESISSQ
jgi:membrane associated rhomboid family serine protease